MSKHSDSPSVFLHLIKTHIIKVKNESIWGLTQESLNCPLKLDRLKGSFGSSKLDEG